MSVHIFTADEENYNICIKKGLVGLPEPKESSKYNNVYDSLLSRLAVIKENDYILGLYELNTLVAEAIVEQGQNWDLDNISQEEFVFDNAFIQAIHDLEQAHQDGTFALEWIDNF